MIKLAVVGTGGMGNYHASCFSQLRGCKIVAACDVDHKRLAEFAAKHKIPKTFASLDELLKWGQFDAATNVTPDRFHAPVSLALLEQGKHVLCEKPLAVCYSDAAEMARTAASAGVINMVNFSYRNNAALHKAHALVQKGDLGRIIHVEATYFQNWLVRTEWEKMPNWLWRLSTAHGSKGVLGDIGVHLLDFASYPVGDIASVYCRLKTFRKAPGDKVGEYKLDANDSAVITAEFANGALGSLRTTRWASPHLNSITLALYGDEGALRIDLDRSGTEVEVCRVKNRTPGPWKTIKCAKTPSLYERFLASIRTGVPDQPDFARGAAVQKVLDACAQSHSEGRTVLL